MAHYLSDSGEEITKKDGMSCPECGKDAGDFNTGAWIPVADNRCSVREITCACFDCNVQYTFQEVKYWDEE